MVVKDSLSRLFTTLLAAVLVISLIPMSPAFAGSAQEELATEPGASQEAAASNREDQMAQAAPSVPAVVSEQDDQVEDSKQASEQYDAIEQDVQSTLTTSSEQNGAQIAPQAVDLQE